MPAPEKGAAHPDLDVEDELATHTTSSPRAAPSQIEQLPALIDRATRCLAEARTSAEVLDAKAAAEAALHYAKVTKAANETQAHCLRMIVRAEMRMADEIDRGQASGEVASAGDNPIVRASDNQVITYESLGIDRRRVAEWRAIRDADPAFVEKVIAKALAEDRAPTKADIHRAVAGGRISPRGFGSDNSFEWYTPSHYLECARQVLGEIDVDPASSAAAQQQVQAAIYYTRESDGLGQPWHGRVWCNPPYARRVVEAFVQKLLEEFHAGRTTEALLLTNAYSDTAWWHQAAAACSALCLTKGRIYFLRPDGEQPTQPNFGSSFFYYGHQVGRFRAAFAPHGLIMRPAKGAP
jgi:hypothetical protein